MNGGNRSNASSNIRKTAFNRLKQQQRALNMQIRLAMQLHDTREQARLEKELAEITERIRRIG